MVLRYSGSQPKISYSIAIEKLKAAWISGNTVIFVSLYNNVL